jgi:hypothetical protein
MSGDGKPSPDSPRFPLGAAEMAEESFLLAAITISVIVRKA